MNQVQPAYSASRSTGWDRKGTRVYDFFKDLANIALPVFVVSTMFNVGLTQKLSQVLEYLRNRGFFIRMLVANFIAAPLTMIVVTKILDFAAPLEAGLIVFSVCAGAPFLIKLTLTSEHDLALGAAVMLVLVIGTVVVAPLLLPVMLEGINVDAWEVTQSLFLQLILPIIVGMLLVQFLTDPARRIQPFVARAGNYTLYLVIIATLIGYAPSLWDIVKTGALLVGLGFVLVCFGYGYLAGSGKDHLQDVGGLGTAQRNTAASMVIALQNFTNSDVFVMITLVNTLGIVLLIVLAQALKKDNGSVEFGMSPASVPLPDLRRGA
jgi:BASS family bile acid:Na+ symporter